MPENTKIEWESYRDKELERISRVAKRLGFTLDETQIHTQGERYLQSGRKLVLTGIQDTDGKRVVLKGSSHPSGKLELAQEHERRELLNELDFAYRVFHSPAELVYLEQDGMTLSISEYLDEPRGFLEYSFEDQFFLALDALKAQEGVHATTARHAQTVRGIFGITGASEYLKSLKEFAQVTASALPMDAALSVVFQHAIAFFSKHEEIVDGYSGFITHTDFVPHNFRVHEGQLYLLDFTSLVFGNKYESWARFSNYMALYNPALEEALVNYVRLNRSEFEYLSFRLMRVYKLCFLLAFYADNLKRTEGDLKSLTELRLTFWAEATRAVLEEWRLQQTYIDAYKSQRDLLRSEEELERQRMLRQL